ncbi:hypothetical protein Chor_003719 [Crotalus horridus]
MKINLHQRSVQSWEVRPIRATSGESQFSQWTNNGNIHQGKGVADNSETNQIYCLGSLQEKLSGDGMANVSFMIVNEKTPFSRAMYWELKRHAPKGIPVYQQQILEPDVWQILKGNKDDFLIYDRDECSEIKLLHFSSMASGFCRCKKLTFHIQLPYSFLHLPYVEAAVRYTYHKDYCGNCSWYYLNSSQEVRV